jgi:hypothetical protein
MLFKKPQKPSAATRATPTPDKPRSATSPVLTRQSPEVSMSRAAGIISTSFNTQDTKRILDFGSLTQGSIDFFGQFSCRYDVMDMFAEFEEISLFKVGLSSDEAKAAAIKLDRLIAALPQLIQRLADDNTSYDVIFLWDILNYLTADQVDKIFHSIQPYCHWKTHILCLFPITKEIPRLPMLCSIIDRNQSVYRNRPQHTPLISNPQYERKGLKSLTQDFKLTHSSLLQNGIKECIYGLRRAEREGY